MSFFVCVRLNAASPPQALPPSLQLRVPLLAIRASVSYARREETLWMYTHDIDNDDNRATAMVVIDGVGVQPNRLRRKAWNFTGMMSQGAHLTRGCLWEVKQSM